MADLAASLWPPTRRSRRLEAQVAEERARVTKLRRRVRHLESKVTELRGIRDADHVRIRTLRARVQEAENVAALTALPDTVTETIEQVRAERLTFLAPAPLVDLARAVLDLEVGGVAGEIIECGTARGGSAIVLAAAKSPERTLRVYDVFGMIPPPSDRDGDDVHARYETIVSGGAHGPGGETYYGYRDELYEEVVASFSRLGLPVGTHAVQLVRGLFEDTITGDEPVALAHLDGDWYESTRTCLERIAPRVVPGGRLVIDDYFSWSGCRTAVDEFLATHDDFHRELHSRLHLVRG